MKQLMLLAAVTAIAVAKPELYKEKEDFQFSRSSTDEGSKSGFYGAQRGNMGGNYERAHNMDSLAQNQMSGLVRQVEGELGDGAKMRTGSVYTAANSRGTFGSRHFDLSNLQGRNFQEGASYDSSHLNSGLSSSAFNNAAYRSHSQSSQFGGYQTAEQSGMNLHSDSLQSLDNSQAQYDFGRHSSHRQGAAYAGYGSSSDLHSADYGSNVQTRLISATPVRIIVRPGTKVAIPVAAQTYDVAQGSSINHNSLNSDAEVLGTDNQHTVYRPGTAKHYEASYNYRKQWEKHDTIPATVVVPTSTDNPFPRNSELYEDSQARASNDRYEASRLDAQRLHSSNIYGGYNGVKSSSHVSNSNYNTQQHRASSDVNSNAYTATGINAGSQGAVSETDLYGSLQRHQYNGGALYHGAALDTSSLRQAARQNIGSAADLNSQVESINSKPKSYQSSYSYHKSWERQGDPYVIKPASDGSAFDSQSSQRLTSAMQNHGYAVSGSHYGHLHQSGADCDENGHIRVARSYRSNPYHGTQQQSQNLEDLGQQTEDLGQQSVTGWDQQQSQNTWDQAENLNQQSQHKWDRIEDLGQQSQHTWDKFDQQSQNTFDKIENLDQQTQNLGQQTEDLEMEIGQKPSDFGQETQHEWNFNNAGQQEQEAIEQTGDFQKPEPQTPFFPQESLTITDDQNSRRHRWDAFGSYANGNHNYQHQHEHHHEYQHEHQHENQHENQHDRRHEHQQEYHHEHEHKHENERDHQQEYHHEHEHKHENERDHQQEYNHHHEHKHENEHDDQQEYHHEHEHKHENEHDHQQEYNHDHEHKHENERDHQQEYHHEHEHKHENERDHQQEYHHEHEHKHENEHEQENQQVYQHEHHHYYHGHNYNWQSISENEHAHGSWSNSHQTHNFGEHSNTEEQSTQNNGFASTRTSNGETEQKEDSGHGYNLYGNGWNAFANTQDQSTNTQDHSFSNVNSFQSNSDPLSKLWNKLDNIEQLSIPSTNKDNENINKDTFSASSQNSYNSFQGQQSSHETSIQQQNEGNKNVTTDTNKSDENQFVNVNSHAVERPEDVGRGDISSEDLTQDLGNNKKPNTNPIVIAEDQTHKKEAENKDSTSTELHVLGLNENSSGAQQSQHSSRVSNVTTNTQKLNKTEVGQHESLDQQNVHSYGQQENLEQNLQDFSQVANQEQQNLQDFGQQQNLHDFEQKENLDQQNLHAFGQQENLEQQSFHEFGQQENVEQQNLHEFGHQENLEQQNLHDFAQQENLEQQNLHDFGQQQNLDQQNLHEFGQQQNLEQQNTQNFEGRENLEQNLQDFNQHENLDQQNMHDFGQQENLEQQNLHEFGQQENLEQQNLHEFGQQENLEQQNLHEFGQQENLDQQNLHEFGQQENLEQQNLHEFGQQENLEQQNLHEFGQQENLEQQITQNFQGRENLEQNLQDFNQHENLDQQNMHDFGQQENLGQQNLHEFEQIENLEQQNVQDFGQQQNLPDFGQQVQTEHHFGPQGFDHTALQQFDKHLNSEHLDKLSVNPNGNLQTNTDLQHPVEVEEPAFVQKINKNTNTVPQPDPKTEVPPPDTGAEKPGFWKSVGSKFSNAKSKIASWFSSSS
ncbi:unnamed protein product [Chrysodeixis includens]|uniref:Uncharacterized protein n=1 Tax=Chrysodeixis includens TaxID=689277 RepID=A0A9N8KW10_CHRIL|nr:unnamed protein product [Chrysodeixis includens]